METEMTNELKAKFFAQYYGQKVMQFRESTFPLQKVGVTYLTKYGVKHRHLALKPLSSITDEDAIEVAKLYGWKNDNPEFKDRILQFKIDLPCIAIEGYSHRHRVEIYDYLRSKGYVLPFMGISVEKQVQSGWVKLVENTKLTDLPDKPLTECMMGRDCECNHPQCPVTDEDEKNGKYCTLPLYDYRE